ncbi:hypothetical protein QHA02_001754, partial [Campylobacter jejuni]|nr:hypothetical protein [Campylobacter jejuni]
MFHVCYSSSAEYIKYVAVSIFNIIKMSKKDNLKYFLDNHQPIPYHFHVFIENDNLEA